MSVSQKTDAVLKTEDTSLVDDLNPLDQNYNNNIALERKPNNEMDEKKNKKVKFNQKIDEIQIESYKKFNRANTSSKSGFRSNTIRCQCLLF